MRKPNNLQEKIVYDGYNAIIELIIGWVIIMLLMSPFLLMKNL